MAKKMVLSEAEVRQHFQKKDNWFRLRGDFTAASYLCNEQDQIIGLIYSKQEELEALEIGDFPHLCYLNLGDNGNLAKLNFQKPLPALERLDISDSKLRKFALPEGFAALKHLDLSRNALREAAFKGTCPKLTWLDLSGNQIKNFTFPETLTALQELFLGNNPLNESLEVYHDGSANYLEGMRKLQEALKLGQAFNKEYKVILVGDGKSGKTCLVIRLVEDRFEPEWDSTHGISVKQYEDLQQHYHFPYILNLWDFGGQDIYHTTHRLFMQANTTYLLLWNWENEFDEPYTSRKVGKRMHKWENRRLKYWMRYIAHMGRESPVIVVQSQSDRFDPRKDHPLKAEIEQDYPHPVAFVNIESAEDAPDDSGYQRLLDQTKNAINNLKRKEMLPKHWIKIRQALIDKRPKETKRTKRDFLAQESKTISLDEYLALAKKYGEAYPMELLNNWLVRSGVVFYKEGLFNNQIILDQEWAIRAIYTLFDRSEEGCYHDLKEKRGRFSGQYLSDIWSDKPPAERELLISFMLSCHICFEIKDRNHSNYDFDQRQFIAPEILPEERPSAFDLIREGWEEADYQILQIKYAYSFLHYGIIQRFIVETHAFAEIMDRDMYKNGIILQSGGDKAMVEAFEGKDEILVKVPARAKTILDKIRNLFNKIHDGALRELVSLEGQVFVDLKKLKEKQAAIQVEAEDGTTVNVSDYKIFLELDEKQAFELEDLPKKKQKPSPTQVPLSNIFFSYAWGEKSEEGKTNEKIVDDLYDSLTNDGFTVIRDNMNLDYGGYISRFMEEIGKGDLVIVFISDPYVRSPYCMFELTEIARNSKWEKQAFSNRILPVPIEFIQFDKAQVLTQYFEYWKQEEQHWENLVTNYPQQVGPGQFRRYQNIKTIQRNFGELSDWLSDIYQSTTEALSANNFEQIKLAILKRLQQLEPSLQSPEHSIAQMIQNLEQKILSKLDSLQDILQNLPDQLRQDLEKAIEKADEGRISEQDMLEAVQQIKDGMEKFGQNLPAEIIRTWKQANQKPADQLDLKGKFKINIPLIPLFLKYEKEISTDLSAIAKNIYRKGIIF